MTSQPPVVDVYCPAYPATQLDERSWVGHLLDAIAADAVQLVRKSQREEEVRRGRETSEKREKSEKKKDLKFASTK